MVEQITAEAIRLHTENLKAASLLDPALSAEIEKIAEEMDGFSNWVEAGKHLRDMGSTTLEGAGPMSKFLRTLAYALESLEGRGKDLAAAKLTVSRVALANASSGCSDYRGDLRILAKDSGGAEVEIAGGPFVWDCGAQGMPQPQAAQEMGYRCMVSFPEIAVGSPASS